MADEFEDAGAVAHDPYADLNTKLGALNRTAFGPLAGPTHNLMGESGLHTGGVIVPGAGGAAPPTLGSALEGAPAAKAPIAAPEPPTLGGTLQGGRPVEGPVTQADELPVIEPPASVYGDRYAPSAPNSEFRVATRVPVLPRQEGVPGRQPREADVHTNASRTVDVASMAETPNMVSKVANLIRQQFPGVAEPGASDEQVIDGMRNHLADNYKWLYDNFPAEHRDEASQWYDGAHAITNQWAQQYNLPPQGVAGAIASLSPQMDWFKNVSLAGRILDVRSRPNATATPEMLDWVQNKLIPDIQASKTKTPEEIAQAVDHYQMMAQAMQKTPLGQINDPDAKALFVRAYDEAHNSRSYPLVTPGGQLGDNVTTKAGDDARVGWGSFGDIKRAMSVLDDPRVANISEQMGGNHKIRSFYNNIVSPMSDQGDVTIDTHAIAGGLLKPLAGNDLEVKQGLGMSGPGSDITGIRGLYPVYADAMRQAALQAGVLPRQMQSITWEGGRSLFTPVLKRNPAFKQDIANIWDRFHSGEITADDARNQILQRSSPSGRIDPPVWTRQSSEEDD